MAQIKLVLTDIDGTLVKPGMHDPSSAVKKAIKEVQKSGVQVTAATGRPYEMAVEMFMDLGLEGLCIFDAGASIRDVESGSFAYKNWLSVDRIRSIVEIILPRAREIDFFPIQKQLPAEGLSLDDVIEEAPYVFAFAYEEFRHEVESGLSEIKNLSIHFGHGREENDGVFEIQITDVSADKFHAVNELRKIVHSTKEETLAIGDSTNDMPLFENAGLKIAMGNAIDELKQLADYVTETLDNDGFAVAMNKFVLDKK